MRMNQISPPSVARPPKRSWRDRIPLLLHLRGHTRGDFVNDAIAGTITAILVVPQVLAYALLAGLPPQMGLYAAIVAPLVYALTGSSRTVIVGPAAVQAVMVAAALAPLGGDPAAQVAGALIIGALSGAILFAMGLLRLGWITNFISNPVLSGFTTGAVIYIMITQLGTLLSIPLPREAPPLQALLALLHRFGELQPATAICGTLAIICLVLARGPGVQLMRRLGLPAPLASQFGRVAPLLVVLLFTLLSTAFALSRDFGVPVVGAIPQGLPSLHLQIPRETDWHSLVSASVLIAAVGYIETLSVAKALAFRRRERVDPDRELIALGMTNMAGAAFGAMPTAGSFSKSMVNFEAGARTQLAGMLSAAWVLLCAALFTGLLHELPRTVLAAIIMVSVYGLLDFKSVRDTWRYDRGDGFAQVATIVAVLSIGVEKGLLIGTGLAAALFLYRTSRPHILVVGLVPGTQHFRSVHRNDVITFDHLLLIRIDENLYFANTPRVETELQRLVAEHPRVSDVVIILSGIGYIDASSLDMLDNFERDLAHAGVRLHLAEFKSQVLDRLRNTDLFKRLDPKRIHRTTYAVLMSFDPDIY